MGLRDKFHGLSSAFMVTDSTTEGSGDTGSDVTPVASPAGQPSKQLGCFAPQLARL